MQTKKLIELLLAEDPTGEKEVCVGNEDILCLESKPAYWDGCLQILERNWDSKYYNVTGAIYTSSGSKIEIRTLGISGAIENNPDLPVKIVDEFVSKRMAETVAGWRQEVRKTEKELADQMLVEVLHKYREGWKAAQAIAEPLTHCNVQWWFKNGDTGTKRLYSNDPGQDKQIALCYGHSKTIVKSGFFKAVNDGQRIIWELSVAL